VAVYEAVKGILVLGAAGAAFEFVHMDVQKVAERLVSHFHLNPASHYPRIFLKVASNLSDIHILALGLGALSYAVIRLVEAYGLWHGKRWAWIFGMASAGLYLPIEIYELIRHVNGVEVALFLTNIMILAALWRGRTK
jgi:uncharacterized membrane protein (DUF2068 family)